LRPIKKLRSSFRAQKNVPEKKRTKAAGRLRFFVGQARYCGRSIYSPVMRSAPVLHLFYIMFILILFLKYFIALILKLFYLIYNRRTPRKAHGVRLMPKG
jgi:hypothetical protein